MSRQRSGAVIVMSAVAIWAMDAHALPFPTATPTPTCSMMVAPDSGPPETHVTVRGACRLLLYHRPVSIYFDDTLIAQVDDIEPAYSLGSTIPGYAVPGPHVLWLRGGLVPPRTVSASFEVTPPSVACSGDCNSDREVTIDELLTGVGIALGYRPPRDCPAIDFDADGAVSVDELVRAVGHALLSCTFERPGCHDAVECMPGSTCVPPGIAAACGACPATECQTDIDCRDRGDHFICAHPGPEQCACQIAQVCRLGCGTDADCASGEECDSAHHCVAQSCAVRLCPPDFNCEPVNGSLVCVRRLCDRDAYCLGGFCLGGSCYDQLGRCVGPTPSP